jgi:hypothetical protein
MSEKMFPISGTPSAIPWSVIAPFERQAMFNHDQTLERLSERGGLSTCEAIAIIEGRKWKPMDLKTATERLNELVDKSLYAKLTATQDKLAKAISALRPFAKIAEFLDGQPPSLISFTDDEMVQIELKHYRLASTTLAEIENKPK